MNKFSFILNILFLYFTTSYRDYTFINTKKYINSLDDFKLITYDEFLKKQCIKYDGIQNNNKIALEKSLQNINIKQQDLIKEEYKIQNKRNELNIQKEGIIKELNNIKQKNE